MIGPVRSLGQDASVLNARIKPGTTRRILALAVPYRRPLGLFMVLVFVDAALGAIVPLLYREIVNEGILQGRGDLVVRLALLAALLSVITAGLALWQSYLSARIGNDLVRSLRKQLFAHVQAMPLAFFTRIQTGSLVSRLNTDVGGAQNAFTEILSNVFGNFVSVAFGLGAMFILSPQITVGLLVFLPMLIWPARWLGRTLQAITRETFTVSAAMNTIMIERFNVSGAQLSKLLGRADDDVEVFAGQAARLAAINVRRAVYGRFFYMILTLMSAFTMALAYGWGGILAIRGALDIGTIVALVAYMSRVFLPLTGLSNVQVTFMAAAVSFERVFEVLDLRPSIQESPEPVDLPPGPATVIFDRVSFRYPAAGEVALASLSSAAAVDAPSARPVLEDVTFTARPGQMIGIVGPSGAGKTTLSLLASRLYDPVSGTVSINGVDLRQAKLRDINRRVAMVTQDTFLFHDSIRANLLYAKPDATDAELRTALRGAQIMPLIDSLPAGLDTWVGERGYRFSGGEKQRLSIARVLLRAPDVVILDEATAHLDSESEAAVQRALDIARAGRTSLVIAHRLSTILQADQILVVDGGRIVERGTHATLVAADGLYASLYRRPSACGEEHPTAV